MLFVQDERGQLFLESESERDSDWDAGKAYCLKGLRAQVKWQGCKYILQLQYCTYGEILFTRGEIWMEEWGERRRDGGGGGAGEGGEMGGGGGRGGRGDGGGGRGGRGDGEGEIGEGGIGWREGWWEEGMGERGRDGGGGGREGGMGAIGGME